MVISIFFAKIFGVFAIVKGLAILFRRKECEELVSDLVNSKAVIVLTAAGELLFGLIVVILHNFWFPGFAVIVTILGWLMVIEGIFLSFAPHHLTKRFIQYFNKPVWYNLGVAIALVLGVYLLYSSSFHGFYGGFHRW
ncbi:hypothetical protein H6775_02570 [Candidatus Nomurabacteria bacterium]|nr:hypothetical protein [Candidatus Nomurabacteria bacterium]